MQSLPSRTSKLSHVICSDQHKLQTPPPPEASTWCHKPLQLLCRDARGFAWLELGPGAGRHSLPRSCWDLRAVVEVQALQSHRFAQNLEKICGAIDAFAVVVKASGARWDRKDWTTKISIQSDIVATDYDIDSPKLSPTEQHPESIHMWFEHSSKTFVNVAHQSKWEQQISISGNISTSSAKLPQIKSGNLQVPPVGTVQPLPRSCWDETASCQIQTHHVAQGQVWHDLLNGGRNFGWFVPVTFEVDVLAIEPDQVLEGFSWKTHGALGGHQLRQGDFV